MKTSNFENYQKSRSFKYPCSYISVVLTLKYMRLTLLFIKVQLFYSKQRKWFVTQQDSNQLSITHALAKCQKFTISKQKNCKQKYSLSEYSFMIGVCFQLKKNLDFRFYSKIIQIPFQVSVSTLTLSLPVHRYPGDDTDLPQDINISKTAE